jgi:arylsulfatase A-like enzyme
MDRPSAVCLLVDGLQAGFLGSYGNTWVQTPAIDRLASVSFLFDQALAPGPTLDQAYAALWHGRELATNDYDPRAFSPALPAVAHAQRVHARLVTDEPRVAAWGEAAGFGAVSFVKPPDRPRAAEAVDQTQIARLLAVAAEEWLTAPRPCLLWVHSQGLCGPWDAPYALRQEFQDEEDPDPPRWVGPPRETLAANADPDHLLGILQGYAGQLRSVDTCVEEFLDVVDAEVGQQRALWTLLAPRGFPLGEHGQVGLDAASPLQGELLHVPWLIRGIGSLAESARSSALVQLADLPGTLASWLQLDPTAYSFGSGVLPLLTGESDSLRELVGFRGIRDHAVRTAAWFCRVTHVGGDTPATVLYAKPDDRWEVNDVHDRCPEVLAELSALAAEWAAAGDGNPLAPPRPLSDAARLGSS